MKNSELEALLKQSESEVLDFKRDQYPLSNAKDEQKAKLVKDILAIANACRDSDGHIVTGVEVSNGVKRVVGATALDDADVQQLLKSKTNRPISFLVETFIFRKKSVTVITIHQKQDRWLYLRDPFGGTKSNVVFTRQGSSTIEISPDELIAFERNDVKRHKEQERAEKADRLLRDFHEDLPRFHNTSFRFKNTAYGRYFHALAEHALPAKEIEEYFRQARELDMPKKFVDDLGSISEMIKKIENCRLTSDFSKHFDNLRSDIDNVYIFFYTMEQNHRASRG